MDMPETDTRDGVAVVKSAGSATTEQAAEAPLSLKRRMAAIRAECDDIGKQDIQMESVKGVKYTIKGHTFEAVLSEIRPLLNKHGVSLTPNLVEKTYAGNRCDVLVDFLFERLDDSEEQRIVRWGGAGTDNGDKGFSKAGTNCVKEMLKKVFLVTDRDDAKEEEEKVLHEPDGGARKEDLVKAREEKRAAIQSWANTFKAALENAKTEKDVQRLQRENEAQLIDDSLPDVTRTFFIELIMSRRNALRQQEQQ